MRRHNLDFDVPITPDEWEQLGRTAIARGGPPGGLSWDGDGVGDIAVFARVGDAPTLLREAVEPPGRLGPHEREVARFVYTDGRPYAAVEAVPQPTAPGEHASPTQPIPTKPAPFDRQGLTYDDLIDWPELKDKARAKADSYLLGPIFTPAPLIDKDSGGKRGWIQVPGIWGAGNWHTGGHDDAVALATS